MPKFGFHTTGPDVVEALKDKIEGRTFLITGPSTGGLGAETALYLARGKPSTILLLGRSLPKIQPVIDSITAISPTTKVHYIHLDLNSLSSVRTAAEQVLKTVPKINVLINNAGIMALHNFQKSEDGIEMQFAANHLGHFLLTNLLMPLIIAAGPGSRIVNVSSAGHALGNVRFGHPALKAINFNDGREYDEWEGYGQAKCANVLFALSLASKLKAKGIEAFSLHPGNIHSTGLGANLVDPDWPAVMASFEKAGRKPPGQKSIEEGCSTILAAALDPSLKGESGAYLDDCAVSDTTAFASDPGNAAKLWALSEDLVGEKFVY